MKRIIISSFLLLFAAIGFAQYDNLFNTTYYQQKLTQFLLIPDEDEGEIIFLGDSITDIAEWADIFKNAKIKNRGISGDNTYGILNRLQEVIDRKPSRIFIMVGINDLAANIPDSTIVNNYTEIITRIKRGTPQTIIYIQSILPTNNAFTEFQRHQGKEGHIQWINAKLKALASSAGCTYVDLFTLMQDGNGVLNKLYTNDGLHLTGEGYMVWKNELINKKYCCQ